MLYILLPYNYNHFLMQHSKHEVFPSQYNLHPLIAFCIFLPQKLIKVLEKIIFQFLLQPINLFKFII